MAKTKMLSRPVPQGKMLLKFFLYAWLVVSVIVTLFPLLWMLWASLSKGKLLSGVALIPNAESFSWEHYVYLFTYSSSTKEGNVPDYVAAFGRTLMVAVLNVGLVVVTSTMVGYAVSRFRFRGKKALMYSMLVLQLFPPFMGMFALLVIFRDFGWLKNANYLVLLYAAGAVPLNTFMLRGYFRAIPQSLDEAAMIDGATRTKTFTRILLPLVMPMVGFFAVNAFMAPWMDFMVPSAVLDKKSETLAVLLYRWTDVLQTQIYNPLNFMAGGLLLGIPIMIVQFYMQRYVMYGLTSGADKG